jgi:hypothetical protein
MNSLIVTEIIARSIENGCKEMLRKGIMSCGEKYGFNGVEALEWLGVDGIKLERKVMRRSKGKGKSIPLPFSKMMVREDVCSGLRYNSGLYTQCKSMKEMGKRYCKGCEKECVLSGKEMPDNGCIEDRMKVGIMEFKDPKGRSPKEYYKVLKKMNISMEEACIEAGKKNYIIDEIHMNVVEKERVVKEKENENKKKGRPKKEKKEVEVEKVKDLFAELVEDTVNSELGVIKVEEVVKVEEVKVSTPRLKEKKVKKVDFVEKEVDKKEKKAKKEKKVKILEVDVESEAKKKAEEEAKMLEAKKKAEEEEAKKLEAKKKADEDANKKEEEPVKVTVTRFEFEGKKYLKSSVNILYDADTKEEMGIWCEESKSIKALPDDDEDEDEEEMEEEDYE